MPVCIFVCLEAIYAFGNKRRVARRQPMHFIIESSAFGQKVTRGKKANRALFALTYCSHINILSMDHSNDTPT